MRTVLVVFIAMLLIMIGCEQPTTPVSDSSSSMNSSAALNKAGTGFDEFGYNYTAMIFSGPADGVDRILDGKVWGDPTYANDHLVMKWNKAWDDARFHGGSWVGAWENNEWNGRRPDGSGWTEHTKIVYTGITNADGFVYPDGSVAIWGSFAIIFDQGQDPNHLMQFYTKAKSPGYGN